MLPIANRLKRSEDFRKVYSRGSSYAIGPVVLYSLKTDGGCRIGFSVSKKLGKAVKRNRIRRLLREAVRTLLPKLPEGRDLVIIARRSAADADIAELLNGLDKACRKCGLYI